MSLVAVLKCPDCGVQSEHDIRAVKAVGHAVCHRCKTRFDIFPPEVQSRLALLGDDLLEMKVRPYRLGTAKS